MRNSKLLLTLLVVTVGLASQGCYWLSGTIKIEGNISDMESGTVAIRDKHGSIVFQTAIKQHHFLIDKQSLPNSDFYQIYISDQPEPDFGPGYEIYLEPGKYEIENSKKTFSKYPIIKSGSNLQAQLSHYYPFSDSLSSVTRDSLSKKYPPLPSLEQASDINDEVAIEILKKFTQRYPDDEIIGRMMAKMNYDHAPLKFFEAFKHINKQARNSEDGKLIENRLNVLTKLAPGANIPDIEGTSLDGKKFQFSKIQSKFVLIEFWRSTDLLSRGNHKNLVKDIRKKFNTADLEILSISIDKDPEWWKAAIQQDSINWQQVNDFKGQDSPNVANWAIKRIPTYSLVTGSGKIVMHDVIPFKIIDIVKDKLQQDSLKSGHRNGYTSNP
jgi:peroxiredoxin